MNMLDLLDLFNLIDRIQRHGGQLPPAWRDRREVRQWRKR